MDIKIKGLSYEIIVKALEQARVGRLEILNELTKTIEQPASSVKPHAPKMVKVVIDGDYIGAVIGPGGKVIQEMQKETGTTIVIEEEDEKGIIEIEHRDPKWEGPDLFYLSEDFINAVARQNIAEGKGRYCFA